MAGKLSVPANGDKPSLGSRLAIITFIISQFIEINLFSISSFSITTGKLLGAVLFPFSLTLMGSIRGTVSLIVLAVLLSLTYSVAGLQDLGMLPNIMSANLVVLIGLTSALIVYTALTENVNTITYLGRMWVFFSTVTALVTIFQAIGLLPLFTVPKEEIRGWMAAGDLFRGVGFKLDPNFQALMLAIGIAFAQFYVNRCREIITGIAFLGIVATFSRMGMILVPIALMGGAIGQLVLGPKRSLQFLGRGLTSLITVIGVLTCVLVWGPPSGKAYFIERLGDVVAAVTSVLTDSSSSGTHLTSAQTRLIAASTGLNLALKNWLTGVGPFQTDTAIFKASGIRNVSHNTYIEVFLIGGVWGIFSLIFYTITVLKGLLRGKYLCTDLQVHMSSFVAVTLVLFVAGFFLSLTFNSVAWFPVTMALALERLSTQTTSSRR